MQEAAQAQSDRALEMGRDKGNMEQAILEMQKRSEAVSIDPDPLLKRIFGFVTKTQRDTFNVAIFQQRTEANTSSLVTGQGRVQLPAPQLGGSVWPCCPCNAQQRTGLASAGTSFGLIVHFIERLSCTVHNYLLSHCLSLETSRVYRNEVQPEAP